MKIRFTRDTYKHEGKPHKEGQVVDVPPASARHWFARDAAVEVKSTDPSPQNAAAHTRMVQDMEKQLSEIANAQPAPVDNPVADGSGTGDGPKPDAVSSTLSLPAGGGRRSSK
jgi:hypothetical protein